VLPVNVTKLEWNSSRHRLNIRLSRRNSVSNNSEKHKLFYI
jgi:hypothetical protein